MKAFNRVRVRNSHGDQKSLYWYKEGYWEFYDNRGTSNKIFKYADALSCVFDSLLEEYSSVSREETKKKLIELIKEL